MTKPRTMTQDENVKRLTTLIAQARGVADLVYRAPNINVDNASPRQVMSDIIDELVQMKKIYEAQPGIFETTVPADAPPFTHDPANPNPKTKRRLQ